MLEVGGDLDFLEEPLGTEDSSQLGSEDLHRHLAMMLQILGEVDRRHATRPELALDPVAVGEGGREPGGDLAHRAKMRRVVGFGEVLRQNLGGDSQNGWMPPQRNAIPLPARYAQRQTAGAGRFGGRGSATLALRIENVHFPENQPFTALSDQDPGEFFSCKRALSLGVFRKR